MVGNDDEHATDEPQVRYRHRLVDDLNLKAKVLRMSEKPPRIEGEELHSHRRLNKKPRVQNSANRFRINLLSHKPSGNECF